MKDLSLGGLTEDVKEVELVLRKEMVSLGRLVTSLVVNQRCHEHFSEVEEGEPACV